MAKNPKINSELTISDDDIEEVSSKDLSKHLLDSSNKITIDNQPIPKKVEAPLILPRQQDFSPEKEMAKEHGSMASSLIGGGTQGLSFGFEEELLAALETGKISGEEYERYRDAIRAERAKQQQEHPIIYGTGMVAGSLAPSIAGGFAAGATKGATTVSSKLVNLLGKGLSKTAAPLSTLDKVQKGGRAIKAGAALGDTALTGAVVGAGTTEKSALEGAEEGAVQGLKWGAPLIGLAHGLPALASLGKWGYTSAADSVPAVKKAEIAYETARDTGVSVRGKQASEAAEKATTELAGDVDVALQKGLRSQESFFKNELIKTSKLVKKVTESSKSKIGKRIGKTIDDVIARGDPIEISNVLDGLIDDVNMHIESGVIQESSGKGLIEQMRKLKETVPPPAVTVQESRVLAVEPRQSVLEDPVSRTIKSSAKIGGKEVSLEDLQAIRERASLTKPKTASIEEVVTPGAEESLIKETQSEILSQPPIPRETVSPEEVVRLRNLTKFGMKSTDPNIRGLHKRTFAKLTDELASQLSEEAKAAYAADRSNYRNIIKLEDKVTKIEDGERVLDPRLVNQLESSSDILSTAKTMELDEIFKLLDRISPEVSSKLRQRALQGSEGLREVQDLMSKYLPNAPGPSGTRVRPGIEKGIEGLRQSYVGKVERSGEELVGALEKAAPSEAAELTARAREVAKKRDLAGLRAAEEPTMSSPNKFAVTKQILLGAGEGAFIRGGQIAGHSVKYLKEAPGKILSSLAPDKYIELAGRAASKGKPALSALLKQAASKDLIGRNAAIYSLSQNHKMLSDLENIESDSQIPEINDTEIESVEEDSENK